MLEPVSKFRFMDLPPEIRINIYSLLLEEEKPIKILTTKVTHEPRRPVRSSFRSDPHPGLKWDRNTHKWIDQLPSAHAILRVSKQIFHETVTIAYGNNRFVLDDFADVKTFLDQIDSTRIYLRHLHITGAYAFPHNGTAGALRSLKGCTDLRTLSINHTNVCQDNPPGWIRSKAPEKLASDCATFLRAVQKVQKRTKSDVNVLDIIKVSPSERCHQCKQTEPDYSERCLNGGSYRCGTLCKDGAAHCEEIEAKIRACVAKELKIVE